MSETHLSDRAAGTWQVATRGGTFTFDLDAMTVYRTRQFGSRKPKVTPTDRFRHIESLAVGDIGRWTCYLDGSDSEYEWTLTGDIHGIDQV